MPNPRHGGSRASPEQSRLTAKNFVCPSRNLLTGESIPALIKPISVIRWLQIDLASANALRSRLRHKSCGRGDRARCANCDEKVNVVQGGVDRVDLKRHLTEPDDVGAEGAFPPAG